jgi:hypothetical protein
MRLRRKCKNILIQHSKAYQKTLKTYRRAGSRSRSRLQREGAKAALKDGAALLVGPTTNLVGRILKGAHKGATTEA